MQRGRGRPPRDGHGHRPQLVRLLRAQETARPAARPGEALKRGPDAVTCGSLSAVRQWGAEPAGRGGGGATPHPGKTPSQLDILDPRPAPKVLQEPLVRSWRGSPPHFFSRPRSWPMARKGLSALRRPNAPLQARACPRALGAQCNNHNARTLFNTAPGGYYQQQQHYAATASMAAPGYAGRPAMTSD